jgi:hypothetical protein
MPPIFAAAEFPIFVVSMLAPVFNDALAKSAPAADAPPSAIAAPESDATFEEASTPALVAGVAPPMADAPELIDETALAPLLELAETAPLLDADALIASALAFAAPLAPEFAACASAPAGAHSANVLAVANSAFRIGLFHPDMGLLLRAATNLV